jgi:hypothetical protein
MQKYEALLTTVLITRTEPVPQFERSWRKVAKEYECRWRSDILSGKQGTGVDFSAEAGKIAINF